MHVFFYYCWPLKTEPLFTPYTRTPTALPKSQQSQVQAPIMSFTWHYKPSSISPASKESPVYFANIQFIL